MSILILADSPAEARRSFAVLARDPQPLILWLPAALARAPGIGLELELAWKQALHQAGWYADPKHLLAPELSLAFCDQAEKVEASESVLCLSPAAVRREADALEIDLSERQTSLVEALGEQGLEPDEALLEQWIAAAPGNPMSAADWLAQAETCAGNWLNGQDPAAEWQGESGAWYRCLQDAALWRLRLMATGREPLNKAIQRVLADTRDWAAQMVLLLYKRRDRALAKIERVPIWSEVIEYYLAHNKGHLDILPPVKDPTVTVMTVTYNRVGPLKRLVDGMIAQQAPWKLVIVDHGSTDGTAEYCRQLLAQPGMAEKIHIRRVEQNQGVNAVSRWFQYAAEQCTTELCMYLSDDDWLEPRHLLLSRQMFEQYPWLGMVTGVYQTFAPDGTPDFRYGPFYAQPAIADTQTELQRPSLMGVCTQGNIVRHAQLAEIVAEDVLLGQPGDTYAMWDFLISMKMQSQFEVGFIPEVVTGFTVSQQTAFAGWDYTYELGHLFGQLIRDYEGLFGAGSYPRKLATYFVDGVLLNMLQTQMRQLLQSCPLDQLDARLASKQRGWQTYARLHQQVLPACLPEAQILLQVPPGF